MKKFKKFITVLIALSCLCLFSSCDEGKSSLVYTFLFESTDKTVTKDFLASYGRTLEKYAEESGGGRFDDESYTYLYYGTREECDPIVSDVVKRLLATAENELGTGSRYAVCNLKMKVKMATFEAGGLLIYEQQIK